jgi:hypothetical protein
VIEPSLKLNRVTPFALAAQAQIDTDLFEAIKPRLILDK